MTNPNIWYAVGWSAMFGRLCDKSSVTEALIWLGVFAGLYLFSLLYEWRNNRRR